MHSNIQIGPAPLQLPLFKHIGLFTKQNQRKLVLFGERCTKTWLC